MPLNVAAIALTLTRVQPAWVTAAIVFARDFGGCGCYPAQLQ
jgi:hypothetical protein